MYLKITENLFHRWMILIFCLVFWNTNGHSQNIEDLLNRKKDSTSFIKNMLSGDPFSVTGNYGLSFRSYNTDGEMVRQTPLSSTLYANATAKLYSITIPVSFILNNLDNFSHPFHKEYFQGMLSNQRNRLSRLGISPYYKWIKVHAGHRYMNFSNYTLSNHNFLGAGIELTPGKLRFAAMAGRLAKAEPIDLALDRPNLPIYRRVGWGFKAGYGTNSDFIDFILFRAKDDANSLENQVVSEGILQPEENLVMAIKGQKVIVKNLQIDFELARSGRTRNMNDDRVERSGGLSLDYSNPIFRRRTSTSYGNAATANLTYRLGKIQLGAGYQRVDPQFRTFGAYFFNDDIENYTAQLSGFGIKNFSFTGTAGLQRNNLDGSRQASYRRFISALNANYQVKTWIFGVNYSNFNSTINYVLSQDQDSLKVVIVTSDVSGNISKSLTGNNGAMHNFNLRGGLQKVNQNLETPAGNPATNMYYANLGYNLRLKSDWSGNLNLDYNQNSLSGIRQDRYGIGGRLGRSFFTKKLDLAVGTQAYRGSSPNDIRSSMQTNYSFKANWKISKLQALQFQLKVIQNTRISGSSTDKFSELIASIGFNGRFEYKPFVKKNTNPKIDQKDEK